MITATQEAFLRDDLYAVLTTRDAAELYGYHIDNIRYHINKGNLSARLSADGQWLVLRSSLILRFGLPIKTLSQLEQKQSLLA